MTALIRLGVALAFAGRSAAVRSLWTLIGALLAALVMLLVLAVAGSQVQALSVDFGRQENLNLLGAVVTVTLLPVIVLLSVVARLSASIRDRRLAALRLIGMTARQTQLVAAVEVAVMSTLGTVAGALIFLAVRASTGSMSFAGQDIPGKALSFNGAAWVAVLVGVPALSVAVSAAPARRVSRTPLQLARQADPARPSLLRLVPLVAGVGVLVWALRWFQAGQGTGPPELRTVTLGTALTGLGMILAVPVLVRRLADVVARSSGHPAALLAARRAQLEPASTTRLAAGLLIGLYVAAGAQCVVAAFESTPQYKSAYRDFVSGPQVLSVTGGQGGRSVDLESVVAEAGVGTAYPTATLRIRGSHYAATITTCAALRAALPRLRDCSDTSPAWIHPAGAPPSTPATLRLSAWPAKKRAEHPPLTIPRPDAVLQWDTSYNPGVDGHLFIPRGLPGAAAVLADAQPNWLVVTSAGLAAANAVDRLVTAESPSLSMSSSSRDREALVLVDRMRSIAWTVSAVVLFVGLASFVIAAIDRSFERRREVAALHVLGAPTSLAWSSQLLQVLVPVVLGVPSAIGLGLLSGVAYLAFGDALEAAPMRTVGGAAAWATLAAVAAAVVSTLGIPRRVSPELLRRE